MGITGLLPFLEKKTARRVELKELSGCTAAIDTYCWLHKGIYTCADKLVMGIQTDGYVTYCMNYINLLLKSKIKPILVFDGRHLPAKAETELKRREQRDSKRKKASELMKMGEVNQAKDLLKKAIDVSHEMALDVIRKCQEIDIDCIVAPYEADAQLAYLNISGIADFVITEDSDLTLFGCTKILFKMDKFGCGTLVEQDKIYLSMKMNQDDFNIEKFRHMCILSGCDYLASLPGVGLAKALKFVQRNNEPNIHKALTRLGSYIGNNFNATIEYRDSFVRALITFKHQLVYCPLLRKQVRLNPPTSDITPEQLHYAGDPVDEELAYQLALGNCNPFGFKKLHNFDPDKRTFLKMKKNNEKLSNQDTSIWSKTYKIKKNESSNKMTWPNTIGQEIVLDTKIMREKMTPLKKKVESSKSCDLKRSSEHLDAELTNEDLMEIYGNHKILKSDEQVQEIIQKEEKFSSPTSSPRKFNPFTKKQKIIETSPSLIPRGRRRIRHTLIAFKPTIIDENVVTKSKFFSSIKNNSNKAVIIPETQDENSESIIIKSTINMKEKNIIPETLDESNFTNNIKKHVIIPETQYQQENETIVDIENKIIDGNSIIPESPNSNNNESNIIPESPDNDELLLSQNSCKENNNINFLTESPKKQTSITRGDSGVDMKEDTIYNNLSDEIFEINKTTSPLNNKIKKYDIKIPENKFSEKSNHDDFDEFSVNTEPISDLKSNFFKWSNQKNNDYSNNQPSISSQNSLRRSTSQIGIKKQKRSQNSKKLPQNDSQQSLLNMFGFKKKNIKY